MAEMTILTEYYSAKQTEWTVVRNKTRSGCVITSCKDDYTYYYYCVLAVLLSVPSMIRCSVIIGQWNRHSTLLQ